jgi:hypothetical protein
LKNLIFIEGLWHTGKSHFLSLARGQVDPKHTLIHDNLREFGSVRHASFHIFPKIYSDYNQIFDRSPITLKAIADPIFGLYNYKDVLASYWDKYFNEWIEGLKQLEYNISVIYFLPFSHDNTISDEIIEHIRLYPKNRLLIKGDDISQRDLVRLNDIYLTCIDIMSKNLGSRFYQYQVDYRNSESASQILFDILTVKEKRLILL